MMLKLYIDISFKVKTSGLTYAIFGKKIVISDQVRHVERQFCRFDVVCLGSRGFRALEQLP